LPLAHSIIGVVAFAAILGLGNGISAGVVMTIGSDFSPELGRPQFLAGWRLTTGVGQAAGPLLITAIASVAPLSLAALAIGAIGYLGAGWLWHWLPAGLGRSPSSQ
jgi:MFS family permease